MKSDQPSENHGERTTQSARQARRPTENEGDDQEVKRRYGLFRRYNNIREDTEADVEPIAILAFHLIRSFDDSYRAAKGSKDSDWYLHHWNRAGPTAFLAVHDRSGLLQAPETAEKYMWYVRSGYLNAGNMHAAALGSPPNLLAIRIAYGRRTSISRY